MIVTILVALIVLLVNIPFGYWRGSTKKFSFAWFVSIHLPVLISILLRHVTHIEFKPLIIVIFVSVFFFGQFSGKLIYSRVSTKIN